MAWTIVCLLAFEIVAFLPGYLPEARAVAGEICLANPSTSSSSPCPNSSPVFNGPFTTPNQQLKIGVYIQGSAPLNGFDIILKTNNTILTPAGIDLSGTVLKGQTQILVECLSGILISGNLCAQNDSSDTLHLAAFGGLGTGLTSSPTTGLLFIALYNIKDTGSTNIGFQNGCGSTNQPTSVPPDLCVTIANGSTLADSETIQTANFDNKSPLPYLTLSANPTSLASPGTSTISVTGNNSWPGSSKDSITFSTQTTPSLNASLSRGSCTPAVPCSTTLNLSGGSGSAIVYGTYTATDSSGSTSTLAAQATVSLTVPAFVLEISQYTVNFEAGQAGYATVKLTPSGGWTGQVFLRQGVTSPPNGLSITFNGNNRTLASDWTTLVMAIFSSQTPGTYQASILATSGSITRSVQIFVLVRPSSPNFVLTANPTSAFPIVGTIQNSTITVISFGAFNGTVELSHIESSTSLTCNLNPKTVTGGSGTSTLSCIAHVPGTYTSTVTGISRGLQSQTSFTIYASGPDFILSSNPVSILCTTGSTKNSTITVTAENGFDSTVNLQTSISPTTGLTATLSKNIVSGSGSSTLSFTCNTQGWYNIKINGTSGLLSHVVTVNVYPPAPDFSISASPVNISCKSGDVKTSTITITALNGFIGKIFLTTASLPSQISTRLDPTNVTGSGTAMLTITCETNGTFNIAVRGSIGSYLTRGVTITVNVSGGLSPASMVCLNTSVSTAVQCPSSPPTFTGAYTVPNQQLRVQVFIQGSNAMNGFDITLKANHTILKPVAIDLTGTVLPGEVSIIVECFSGVLKAGSLCASTDTIDTLHLAVTAGLGTITTPPTTGLLFTAIYNITGTGSTNIIFQNGCGSITSVQDGTCITISNGSTSPNVETAQIATFDNTKP